MCGAFARSLTVQDSYNEEDYDARNEVHLRMKSVMPRWGKAGVFFFFGTMMRHFFQKKAILPKIIHFGAYIMLFPHIYTLSSYLGLLKNMKCII